jgi:hypothetical protein
MEKCIFIGYPQGYIYLHKVLEHFDLINAKVAPTPLPMGYVPTPNEAPVDENLCHKFQELIGSLLYIMLGTHPDIAFAVTKVSQFTDWASDIHTCCSTTVTWLCWLVGLSSGIPECRKLLCYPQLKHSICHCLICADNYNGCTPFYI